MVVPFLHDNPSGIQVGKRLSLFYVYVVFCTLSLRAKCRLFFVGVTKKTPWNFSKQNNMSLLTNWPTQNFDPDCWVGVLGFRGTSRSRHSMSWGWGFFWTLWELGERRVCLPWDVSDLVGRRRWQPPQPRSWVEVEHGLSDWGRCSSFLSWQKNDKTQVIIHF